MAVFAPMPSARATIATIANPGAATSWRNAWRRSCRKPRIPLGPAKAMPPFAYAQLRHVRASVQMAAVRPAISLGLRAATATVPALVFGQLTGRPGLLWMSLGVWLGTLADPGGPYPLRAAAMAGYLVFGALVTMAGAASHGAWSS